MTSFAPAISYVFSTLLMQQSGWSALRLARKPF